MSDKESGTVPAHSQTVSHAYSIHFPSHYPRQDDPHYAAFEAFRAKMKGTASWKCYVGDRVGFDECNGEIEVHHSHIEFALQNSADFDALAKDFPALKDPSQIPAWIESDANFMLLCMKHHRSQVGAHSVAYADFNAGMYVKGLLSKAT